MRGDWYRGAWWLGRETHESKQAHNPMCAELKQGGIWQIWQICKYDSYVNGCPLKASKQKRKWNVKRYYG